MWCGVVGTRYLVIYSDLSEWRPGIALSCVPARATKVSYFIVASYRLTLSPEEIARSFPKMRIRPLGEGVLGTRRCAAYGVKKHADERLEFVHTQSKRVLPFAATGHNSQLWPLFSCSIRVTFPSLSDPHFTSHHQHSPRSPSQVPHASHAILALASAHAHRVQKRTPRTRKQKWAEARMTGHTFEEDRKMG